MNSLTEKLNKVKNPDIWIFILFPVLFFYLNRSAMFSRIMEIGWKMTAVNILFYEVLALMLLFITGRGSFALRAELFITWLFSIANAYVYSFRHTYIRPWDLTSVGTAANVAGNYDYTPNSRMVIATVIGVILFILAGFCRLKLKDRFKGAGRIIGIAATMFIIFLMTFVMQRAGAKEILGIYTTQFDSKGMMKKNGMIPNFMYQMKYLNIDKPDGYSRSEEEEKLSAYAGADTAPEELPDIIVFMDEAFSDPAVDGDFNVNTDYMPFIHSLQEGSENTVTGYINTSVNGGNTPNTEFEFLTGNTMGFLPQGSIAFQQYVRREMDSIPHYLKEYGYQTFASHPYKASGWDRPRVWPLLGFDELYFEEYFEDKDTFPVRNYVSDESYFSVVGDRNDELSKNGPVFSFNVTMQNHSGYKKDDYPNFEQMISVEGVDGSSIQARSMNNYLSLVKYTDTALEKIVERYKDSDRKTMIVFFGDHQPDPPTFDIMWNENNKDRDALSDEDYANTYRVPFVIWANFDIEEMHGIETSVNYLGNLVLKEAGFSLPPYRSFLNEYSEKYPIVSAVRYVDKDGNSVNQTEWGDALSEYEKMQYYEMFDDKDEYR